MQQLKVKTIAQGLSYSRTEKLGEGAFGQVFLGFDDGRKVPCAFKIVNLQKMSLDNNASSLMKKIKDEIVNMQLARHPSIIEFYQAKQSPNNIYILCEYCNGESLASYILRREYLTQWQALQYFRQILQGFYHLRKNNIVHRDLKPANLLLHNYSIKIGDLGFSKVTQNHEQMLESIVGTPLYMSPQIFQREKYTEKTDIWSLGVILYEMLYGRNPWAGSKNLYELRERIKKEVHFPEFPIVSKSLKITIKKMLVVPENDRISWEALFQKYLNPLPSLHRDPPINSYSLSLSTSQYFYTSFYLQSHLKLPKLVRELNLLSEQSLTLLLGRYGSSQQFYKQLIFLSQNKALISQYFNYFLQKRNQLSFTMTLLQKLTFLIQKADHELNVYCYCAVMLGYRYNLSILQEIMVGQQLVLPQNKYLQVAQKLCYDKLLVYLFHKDREIIGQQYHNFMPFFHDLMDRIQSHPMAIVIRNELSGIYSSEHNEKRVVRFFFSNYLKKIYNQVKNRVKIPNSAMVNELEEGEMKEEEEEEEGEGSPGIELTVGRMIGEYLNNASLFGVGKEKGKKNMIQLLYDWQTTVRQHHYVQLRESQPMREDSINSFLKKQFLWSKMSLSPFQPPL